MVLRDLRETDREALAATLRRTDGFRQDDVEVALELIDERLEKGERSEYQFIVAAEGDDLLGYACYGPIPLTESSFDLYWIVVAPRHQRKGVGRALMRRVEESAVRQGGRRVYIDTSSGDAYVDTRAFYTAAGYSEVARFPDFYREGEAKLVYSRDLSAGRG